jgi:hypothetical protein
MFFFKPESHDLLVDNSCVDQRTGNLCNDELEKVYDSTCGDSGTPGSCGKNESRKISSLISSNLLLVIKLFVMHWNIPPLKQ